MGGEAKRGESTLINALLGRDLLPVGVVPVTSVATIVAYGQPERLQVRFRDVRQERHPIDDLTVFVDE